MAAVSAWPAASVLGQTHVSHSTAAGGPAQPKFFTRAEFETLEALCSRIIPTDDTPGAREARVAQFIDAVVRDAPALQARYRDGLAWLDAEAQRKHKRRFVKLAAAQQDAILRVLSGSNDPFFPSVRSLTIDGFYTSKVGLKELGYEGNTYLAQFKGCTHPEHG